MKFDKVYFTYIDEYISEKKSDKKHNKKRTETDLEDNGYDILDTKIIGLITGEVELSLVDTKEKFRVHIKYLDDPKFTGYVHYDNEVDGKRTYKGINTIGELLNYVNIHAEDTSTIYPTLNLLKKEIIAIKRDMDEDEIVNLALEFPI